MSAAARSPSMRPVLARCLPFALYLIFLALAASLTAEQGAIERLLGLPVDLRWLYAIRIALVAGALVFFRRDYVELLASSPVRRADWALSLLIGVVVFVLWINLDSGWVTIGESGSGFVPLDPAGGFDWPLIVVRVCGAAIVVPVMEELFWRSFIQRWIDNPDFLALAPAAVSLRALLIASALFGVEHSQWLAGIIAGLGYGYLYRRSGSLWPAIAAHGLTNFMLAVWVLATGQWYFW